MLEARTLFRYGILGLPLAFAGLPVYVHVPKFYADVLHLDFGTLGVLLLVLRLCDAVSDPLIGRISDHLHDYSRTFMAASVPLLSVGYAALFYPSSWGLLHPAVWLTGCLALVYLSFSTLMINYYARGVDLAETSNDHTRVASFRESSMLLGVLLASLLPTVLQKYFDVRTAYGIFGLLLAPILLICSLYTLSSQVPLKRQATHQALSFFSLTRFSDIRWILAVGFCNAVPAAITSTLFLFFTHDVLHTEKYSGPLLAIYFLSAGCGMPLWAHISRRHGKKRSLMIAMLTAILCFMWAATLGDGDIIPFAVICILSGLTLGADSMLLPALLSDALMDKREATALGFGLWNFIQKLTMAFAAGLVMPLLAYFGYHSSAGNTTSALLALSFCYALLPCVIKAFALILLYKSPLDQTPFDQRSARIMADLSKG